MENKIQLRGRELLFPGGRESKRGEESSKSSWGTGQAVRQPASGNRRTPRGHSPSPAPSAWPQPRPNTASGCLALTQRWRRLQASQNRGVPRKEAGPVSSPGRRRAVDTTSPGRYPTHPSSGAFQHQRNRTLPPERCVPLHLPKEEIPPSHAVQGQKLGEMMLRVTVLQLSHGEIALPRLRRAPPSSCKQADARTSAARARQTHAG